MSFTHSASSKIVKPKIPNNLYLTNKKLIRFNKLTKRNQEKMHSLLSSMNQISMSMFHQSNLMNKDLIKIISEKADNTARKLTRSIHISQKLLQKFDKSDDDDFNDYYPRTPQPNLIRFKIPKFKPSNNEILNNISIVKLDQDEESNRHNKWLKQMSKLNELKGQIMLNEQKKKYSLMRKFEKNPSYVNYLRTEAYSSPFNKKKNSYSNATAKISTRNKIKKSNSMYIHFNQTIQKIIKINKEKRNKRNSPSVKKQLNFKQNLSSTQNTSHNENELTKYSVRNSRKSKEIRLSKIQIDNISNIFTDAYNNKLTQIPSRSFYLKNKRKNYSTDEGIDINSINKEFNFNPKGAMFQSIHEEEVIM